MRGDLIFGNSYEYLTRSLLEEVLGVWFTYKRSETELILELCKRHMHTEGAIK